MGNITKWHVIKGIQHSGAEGRRVLHSAWSNLVNEPSGSCNTFLRSAPSCSIPIVLHLCEVFLFYHIFVLACKKENLLHDKRCHVYYLTVLRWVSKLQLCLETDTCLVCKLLDNHMEYLEQAANFMNVNLSAKPFINFQSYHFKLNSGRLADLKKAKSRDFYIDFYKIIWNHLQLSTNGELNMVSMRIYLIIVYP